MQDSIFEETHENYISARRLYRELGIWAVTAQAWRNFGKIEAKKVGNTWFYPREDLLRLIERRNRRMYPITIDGKPTKRRDIRSMVHDTILQDSLGDYISASDIYSKIGIKAETLRKWRRNGKLRAKKVGRAWHYSRRDLLEVMRTSPV